MAQLCNYPKLAGVIAEDISYATNSANKGYTTIIVGDTRNQTCFNVGVTAIDNWSERQDACWFMGAGVGVYEVPVCYLGGKYLTESGVNKIQTLGNVSYLIRPGIIQRSPLKLYDKHSTVSSATPLLTTISGGTEASGFTISLNIAQPEDIIIKLHRIYTGYYTAFFNDDLDVIIYADSLSVNLPFGDRKTVATFGNITVNINLNGQLYTLGGGVNSNIATITFP